MIKLRQTLTALAVTGLLLPAAAGAQTTAAATATITIPQILFVSIDQPNVTFASPASADFDAGSIASAVATNVTHKGNIVHSVEITADAANMTASVDPVNNIKAATDFQWSNDGGSTYFGTSTTAAKVVTSVPRGVGVQTINYRMLLDYANDAPDTYTLGFTYTVVAN